MTSLDAPDISKIDASVQEIAKLRGDQQIAFVRRVGQAVGVLTVEQRKVRVRREGLSLRPRDYGADVAATSISFGADGVNSWLCVAELHLPAIDGQCHRIARAVHCVLMGDFAHLSSGSGLTRP